MKNQLSDPTACVGKLPDAVNTIENNFSDPTAWVEKNSQML